MCIYTSKARSPNKRSRWATLSHQGGQRGWGRTPPPRSSPGCDSRCAHCGSDNTAFHPDRAAALARRSPAQHGTARDGRKFSSGGGVMAPPTAVCPQRPFLWRNLGQTSLKVCSNSSCWWKKKGWKGRGRMKKNQTARGSRFLPLHSACRSRVLPRAGGAAQAQLQLIKSEPDERYQWGPVTIPLAPYLMRALLSARATCET